MRHNGEELPPLREHVPPGHLPYDWSKRKAGVMARFKNVPGWVQPIGYTTAYEPKTLPGLSLSEQDRQHELTYLVATQHLDLAPTWAELAANGLTAFSKDNPVEGEQGEVEMGDVPEGTSYSLALAEIIEGGRKEAFARERDYQTWHTTRPRRARRVQNAEGKNGVVPVAGSVFAKEELQAMLARRPTQHPEPDEVSLWLDSLPLTETREEFEVEDQLQRYRESRHREGFGSGEACPESKQRRADGTALCQNGRVPITDSVSGTVFDYDDCPTCGGTGGVMALLGTSLLAVDVE